jgi:hypothetical protein
MITWLFGLLLRARDREMILGDLLEERALLAATLSPHQAAGWYRRQMLRSIPSVMWANVRRGIWLKTLGAAIAGYLVGAILIVASDSAVGMIGAGWRMELASLTVGALVMALGGYLASAMRPRAALLLSVMVAAMSILNLFMPTGEATWYKVGLVLVGPAASLAGGRIRIRRREHS